MPPWLLFPPSSAPPFQDEQLSRWSAVLNASETLRIKRIKLASPGFADLVGIGKIVEEVRKLVEWAFAHESRKLDNDKKRLENDSLRMQNALAFWHGAKEIGVSEIELRRLVQFTYEKQLPIEKAIQAGRLVEISESDPD